MALKDWKKVKNWVINSWDIDALVYVRKSNKNDILVVKYYYLYQQYNYSKSFKRFEVLRNNKGKIKSLFQSNEKDEAYKYITEYMRKH